MESLGIKTEECDILLVMNLEAHGSDAAGLSC